MLYLIVNLCVVVIRRRFFSFSCYVLLLLYFAYNAELLAAKTNKLTEKEYQRIHSHTHIQVVWLVIDTPTLLFFFFVFRWSTHFRWCVPSADTHGVWWLSERSTRKWHSVFFLCSQQKKGQTFTKKWYNWCTLFDILNSSRPVQCWTDRTTRTTNYIDTRIQNESKLKLNIFASLCAQHRARNRWWGRKFYN